MVSVVDSKKESIAESTNLYKPLHIWTKTPLLQSNQSINMSIQELLHFLVSTISTLNFSVLYTIQETCRISANVCDILLRLSSEGRPKRTESHEDLLN